MSLVCLYVSMWCRYMQRLHVCLWWVWYVSLGVSVCKCACVCMNGANMIGKCIWEGTCVWLLGPCVCEVHVCECKHTYGGCLWLCRQAHVCAHIHSSAFLCYSISHPSCPHLCSRTSGRYRNRYPQTSQKARISKFLTVSEWSLGRYTLHTQRNQGLREWVPTEKSTEVRWLLVEVGSDVGFVRFPSGCVDSK